MNIPLDEVIYFDAIVTTPSTGAAVDADSTPTFAVYEEETDTDIGVGGNLTKRTSLTGNYRGTFTLSAANGFEVGKWYVVIGSAVVGGVTGKAVLKSFRVVLAEATAGKPIVDASSVLDVDMTAHQTQGTLGQAIGDPVADTNTIFKATVTDASGATIGIDTTALVSATGAGSLTTKTADSATLTTGSTISGAYTDTATDDNTYWITAPVTPAVGGFGLRQQLVFNLPLARTPVNIVIRGYWTGSGQVADVYALRNDGSGTYDKLTNTGTNLASRTTELLYTIPLPRDYADDSGGSFNIVTLEFRTASTTTSHRLRLDQVLVSHLDEQTATTLVVPTAADIWNYVSRSLTTPGIEPTIPPSVEEIRQEIDDNSAQLAAIVLQLDDIPTTTEFNSRTLLSADYAQAGDEMDLVDAPNAMALSAIAVEVESHLLDEGDSQLLINAIVGAIGNTNIDQVVLVAAIRADLERSGGNLNTLLARLTAPRAANLDNLDALVSSRMATFVYTTPPTAAAVASQVRVELGTELGRLDASVSSRASLGDEMTIVDGSISENTFTLPTEVAGTPTGVLGMLRWVAHRLGLRRVRRDDIGKTIETYLEDGTTIATTNSYTSISQVDDIGPAS